MKRLIALFCFSLMAMILIMPVASFAEDVEIQVTIDTIVYMEVYGDPLLQWTGDYSPDPGDFNAYVSGINDPYDYESNGYGWTDTQVVYCWIWATVPWEVAVIGDGGPDFNSTGEWQEKPVGNILWMDGEPNGYHPLKSTGPPVPVDQGNPPSGDHYVLPVTFRVLLNWNNDSPGWYSYDSVVFTIYPQ